MANDGASPRTKHARGGRTATLPEHPETLSVADAVTRLGLNRDMVYAGWDPIRNGWVLRFGDRDVYIQNVGTRTPRGRRIPTRRLLEAMNADES